MLLAFVFPDRNLYDRCEAGESDRGAVPSKENGLSGARIRESFQSGNGSCLKMIVHLEKYRKSGYNK